MIVLPNSVIRMVADPLFSAMMTLVWPPRFTGIWGTKERPLSFKRGDPVPWWLELTAATAPASCTFEVDVEVGFDRRDGWHHIWPVEEEQVDLIRVHPPKGAPRIKHVLLVGAPTALHGSRRPPGRRRRIEQPKLQWQPA